MILGIIALVFLALKVSGLTAYAHKEGYFQIVAEFDNIGSLKVRAPVMVAGVSIGQVGSIMLNPESYRAKVTLLINKSQAHLPSDTTANIYTQGLLGSNYVSLSPGYAETFLKEGSVLEATQPAIVLEKLVGQFLYSIQKKD
jgi:phospholipid/cholesterol/gamma-HCH transport system substrate-binding protein